jgi:hypothetical protein
MKFISSSFLKERGPGAIKSQGLSAVFGWFLSLTQAKVTVKKSCHAK